MAAAPLLAALAACAAAAFWTSESGAIWDGETKSAWHHYEYLAEGFMGGHTYLARAPDPELLRLRDPYDPAQNAGHALWDASLYQGRYYLYFGPAPALAMVCWRALTGHMPAQRLMVAAWAVAGLAALAFLLCGLRRRHFPGVSPAALGGILAVAFAASWIPVLLRRSAVWELPIVAGVACLCWSVAFLWKFHDSGGRPLWALLGGASLALLVGCRVSQLFSAGLVALLFLVPPAGAAPGPRRRLPGFAAALGLVLGGLGLLLYNRERFGSWLEFGQGYQLWGIDFRGKHFFSPAFIPFSARTYLLSLPQFGPYFPFLHPAWSERPPAGYMETEDIYGALFMMPVLLAGFSACAWAWRLRRDPSARAAAVALAAAAGSSLLSALVLFSFGGACSRYTAELLGGWTIATAAGLMLVFGGGPGRGARAAAIAASLWTLACVGLASAEYRGYMRETNPRAYGAVARLLNAPSLWWAEARGIAFGPVDLVVRIPRGCPAGRTVLMAAGRPQRVNFLLLDCDGAGRGRLVLALNEHHVLETPPIALPAGPLRVRIDAPWLYPPADHPYWNRIQDPQTRLGLQTLFAIAFPGGSIRIHSPHAADPVAFAPVVAGPSAGAGDSPSVDSLAPAPAPIP